MEALAKQKNFKKNCIIRNLIAVPLIEFFKYNSFISL